MQLFCGCNPANEMASAESEMADEALLSSKPAAVADCGFGRPFARDLNGHGIRLEPADFLEIRRLEPADFLGIRLALADLLERKERQLNALRALLPLRLLPPLL